MTRVDGFHRQRLCVLPRPLVAAALERPVTRRLVVTDAGVFPRAAGHVRRRPRGAAEAIVIVCAAGSGWVEEAGVRTRVGRGSAVVLPGGVPHAYGADETDPWTIWWCHARGSDLVELTEATGTRPGRRVLPLSRAERATALIDEAVGALQAGVTAPHLAAAAGAAWHLFALLAADGALPREGTPVERALRYLEERVDGSVRVAELASLVGVSPSHLSAQFREATGGGITAHHNALKMAHARTLLDTTDLPVAEVARRVGRDDPFYFSRQFARAHGVSPSAYRAERKG
ncbi:AraC family transcriptional regulator [Microbacterium sp. ZXX196]|uniref:AraC family transcriptional regulator n=1 Tax=Microbacterium sp. ZXX196 TaxID=2609291 RepID=UPI0012B6F839|nr:AraC family transcriptional regulator [Microbacterium sp. ZXX196]MTE24874.1 helix-turn-helix domain-containing protein [Microbacterium sp. ZXX196]